MSYSLRIGTGLAFGIGALLLFFTGNQGNYVVGILGWILGAFALVTIKGQFRPRGGSKPIIRFILGIVMTLGMLAFLGCPLRAILLLSIGNLNGLAPLAGLIAGIAVANVFLKRGYSLGQSYYHQGGTKIVAYLPAVTALTLTILGAVGGGININFSINNLSSMSSPILISLVGLILGAIAQHTRMCFSGGFRDYLLTRDMSLVSVYATIVVTALIGNIYLGNFRFHATDLIPEAAWLWNFLGMMLTGFAAILAGGCPLRQLIMAGEGNTDAAMCLLGMLTGVGLAYSLNTATVASSGAGWVYNFNTAISPTGAVWAYSLNTMASPAGVSLYDLIVVIIGILVTTFIAFSFSHSVEVLTKEA